MVATPFLGAAYSARSLNLASQRCINLYLETVDSKSGAAPGAFYGTPGLDLLTTLGNGPIRGMTRLEGSLYVVSGQGVYVVNSNFTAYQTGTILSGSGLVGMINNGQSGQNQVAIFDGLSGYTVVAGNVAPITPPTTAWNPGTTPVFQDGFGLVNQLGTQDIWQSNLNDLTTWNPLNFSTEDGQTSNVVGLGELHRQVYVFKESSSYAWVNAGNPGFAFQRLDGVSMEVGCVAPNSISKAGESLLWLSQNDQGQGIVCIAEGYNPQRISTHAIEYQIAKYPTMTDAIGYSYQQEGHLFYQLTFPSGNRTWVLDLTTTKALGYPAWHERARFSNGMFSAHQTSTAIAFAGRVVVGDSENGNLYAYDLNTYTDNGAPKRWLRSWRASAGPISPKAQKVNSLEIAADTGTMLNIPNPQMVLRQSFDSQNWSSEIFAPVGMIGQTAQRVRFLRLGIEQRGLNFDRIFELSSSDPFKVALFSAEIS